MAQTNTNLSKLQENFTHLAIACVDIIKLPLIDILDNHIKPSDLKTKLKSSTLISGDNLLPDQKKICYTNPGIPDYNQFDVSLLYKLIRNLCPLKPTKEWGKMPDPANTQLGDDIERLRLFRNEEYAHANSTEISDSEFKKQWTYLQTVINRIQSNKGAFCKSDYRQRLNSLEKRKLYWEDFENYKLLLKTAQYIFQEKEDTDGPDIWIEGPEKVVCGSAAHFKATVKEKRVSSLSVTWQKIINDESKQIDTSNIEFSQDLCIKSVCKKDEGKYQAILSFEENGVRKTVHSNRVSLQVEGGIPDLTTSHETCLQTHSVKLVGNVFLIDDLPVIEEIYWSKDGNKIDTHENEGTYSKVSVDVPSLTIYNVNQYDAGHYILTATNAAGTTVSDAIVLGVPEIVLEECEEGSDGCQVFPVIIKSIPTAYSVQWQVINKQSDTLTPLDAENAEEYRGTTNSIPHSVLVVRRKEQLKNNIYQIKVQNFIGGRIKKISSILNMFYQDRGASAVFAKLSNALAKEFPEEKLNQLHGLILDSLKDKLSIEKKETAREYFDILKENELFTPSDVIFVQFLLRESNCEELNEKCIAYATTQKALCFYEERPRNGYKKVQFHVQGSISNYTARQIVIIKETVAAIIGCDNEEIHVNGLCKSTSFLVVLSMKERYANVLFNMKQQDKDKLISLNINYIILDSNYVYLEKVEEEKKRDKSLGQKIIAPDWLRPSNTFELQEANPQPYTYPEEMDLSRNALLVAGIDFGTTFSGYAFATRVDFENDPLSIDVPRWSPPSQDLICFKTPTTVLMDKNEEFVAFGFEAETKYAEYLEEGKGDDYFYFHHFKMLMYSHAKNLNNDTKISDIRGRKLPVLKFFACAIAYLKNHLLEHLKERFKTEDIYWVLTVPAIWDEKAKFFMRSAAQKAGISMDQLTVALEPEAASIYCRRLPAEKLMGANMVHPLQPGSKYLVLDAGGGTVDITVHEVEKNGQLKELERASGGHWGGTSVDVAFENALAEIVTEEMIETYRQTFPEDYLELIKNFEIKKRYCQKGQGSLHSVITLNIPVSLNEECLNMFGTDLATMISKFKFRDHMIWRTDKLEIKIKFFETFFQPACNGIIKHVKKLFQSTKMEDVNKILMVGGFSESYILQTEIRNAFPNCQVIVPEEAGLAVLRGAVLFGLYPRVINSRVARFTYGVDMNAIFDPEIHDKSKKDVIEGVEYCTGIFDKHVEIGDQLACGEAHDLRFYILLTRQQNVISFCIYTSSKRNPLYIDEPGCAKVGMLQIQVPVESIDRMVYVRMSFGFTEIKVRATEYKTKSSVECRVKLM